MPQTEPVFLVLNGVLVTQLAYTEINLDKNECLRKKLMFPQAEHPIRLALADTALLEKLKRKKHPKK